MEAVKKAKLPQKILISMLVVIVLFNFIVPIQVKASDKEVGGGLFTPIQDLLVWVGDAIMKLMQIALVGNDTVTTKIARNDDASEINDWWIPVDKEFDWENDVNWEIISTSRKAKVRVPTMKISPESIFSGRIPAFDINFFNPQEDVPFENGHYKESEELKFARKINEQWAHEENVEGGYLHKTYDKMLKEYGWENDTSLNIRDMRKDDVKNAWKYKGQGKQDGAVEYEDRGGVDAWIFKWVVVESKVKKIYYILEYEVTGNASNGFKFVNDKDEYLQTGTFTSTLTIEKKEWVEEEVGGRESTAGELRDIVSYWYNILRNIAIVGLLSVLVYIGIRIVLSSAASDKSKYKEMIKDWVIAMFLLFAMHYFMSFTVTIIGSLTQALVPEGNLVVTASGLTETQYVEDTTKIPYIGDRLIGDVRIKLQTGDVVQRMSYTLIYIVLIIYTFIFTIMYLKRVLYMAFFTMMAPIVALTYPLDKARDGKAQAFDMWMKEYTFNALIQPFHLIIYYVLVSSAIDLAIENPIYAIIAIGFMMPAEKLLRKFFGFNKSETSGILSGAFGGALVMQGINYLKHGEKSSGGKHAKDKQEAKKQLRTADSGNSMNELLTQISGNAQMPEYDETVNKDYEYKLAQEKLDKLTKQGFGKGNKEWEEAKEQVDKFSKYKIDAKDIPDYGESEYSSDSLTKEMKINLDDVQLPKQKIEIGGVEEETHRFKAAVTMTGRWIIKTGQTATRLAAKGIGAGTLGAIGVAAGLASDDYSNVYKYGAAGIATGAIVGNKIVDKVSKLPSTAYRIKETYQEERRRYEEIAYSPEQRKIINNKRADNEFLKDKHAIKLYKDKFGNEEYEQAMREALQYRSYGITDDDTIIKAMKLKTKGLPTNKADKKRILIASVAPKLGRKDIDQFGDRLISRGHSQKSAEIMKKAIREFNDFE